MPQTFEIEIGRQACVERTIEDCHTAKTFASGALDVLATPYMIAMMEEAATQAIVLPEGFTTVGTKMEVDHLSATPVGMVVRAIAQVTGCEGKKILLKVEAYDEAGIIGKGTHERFVVEAEKFMVKTYGKLKKE